MSRRRLLEARVASARVLGPLAALVVAAVTLMGCETLVRQADRDVAQLIRERQARTLGILAPADVGSPAVPPKPGRAAYASAPSPTTPDIPPDFEPVATTEPEGEREEGEDEVPAGPLPPDAAPPEPAAPGPDAAAPPEAEPGFTLTAALAYAQQHQREYESAKEELYTAALALTLERHLWTPIFASNLQAVYGNYGEDQFFAQAVRVQGDIGMTQRLPYGGEFTARALSVLIRDVRKSITAEESGVVELGLRVPLLRGAGDVARETLIRLERELTYSVRVFERFRRAQIVDVAQTYFDLLLAKQTVVDAADSLERTEADYERAKAIQDTREGGPLDTLRARQQALSAANALEVSREALRARIDDFKLLIGMPLEEPLWPEDLESIESIEQHIATGEYPLLAPVPAAQDVERASGVALERRLELLTAADRVDDARRGVQVSKNAILPDLDWESTLTMDTDPNHFNVADVRFDRANWRSQITLGLPLERTAERNELRRALIGVRAAERALLDQQERVRAEVRTIVNRIRLQEELILIQAENVHVAERRQQYARMMVEQGKLSNRDKIEAEAELLQAQVLHNQAKTARWGLLLDFRLATETLRVGDDGSQESSEF